MIKPEMVPDEVVEAARRAYETDYGHELSAFTSAIAAALNAWPGAYKSDPALFGHKLILPLAPKEGE